MPIMSSTNWQHGHVPALAWSPPSEQHDRQIDRDTAKVLITSEQAQFRKPFARPGFHSVHGGVPVSPKAIRPDSQSGYNDAPEVVPASVLGTSQFGRSSEYATSQSNLAPEFATSSVSDIHTDSAYDTRYGKHGAWRGEDDWSGIEVSSSRLDGPGWEQSSAAMMLGHRSPALSDDQNYKMEATMSPKPVWWKRKKLVAAIVVGLIAVIALVAGTVIGVKSREKSSNGVCHDTVCSQILSSASVNGQTYVFATWGDGSLRYISTKGDNWTDNWSNLGGTFERPPSALTWNASTRLEVFSVAVEGRALLTKSLQNSKWSDWLILGENTGSTVTPCRASYNMDRADVWVRGDGTSTVIHNFWEFKTGQWRANEFKRNDSYWDRAIASPVRKTSATPAVLCRNSDVMHDVTIYHQQKHSVLHRQYTNSTDTWADWVDLGEEFIADPVTVAPSNDRFDFFGIARGNKTMLHFSWTKKSGYSKMTDLGGIWESVPSVVTSSSSRIDVVAVGNDSKLKHTALVGPNWTTNKWTDLGVLANSAPLAVLRTEPLGIGVFVLGTSGDLLYSSWDLTADPGVRMVLDTKSIGGSLRTNWTKPE